MLQFFRNFFSSKLGIGVTLGLLGVIALAFAAGDVASSGGFGGVAGGDRVAMVGSTRISTSEFSKALTAALESAKRETPTLTMKAFIAGGGLEATLDQQIDRAAIAAFGQSHGITAGKRLVDSELIKIPGLQGLDGKFSDATYQQLLAQRHLTDAEVRGDIAQGLIAKQVLLPAGYGAVVPNGLVMRYAALLKEHRSGAIAALPSAAFAPHGLPADAEIAAFYAAHRSAYIRPERRVIRYARFDDSAVKAVAAPGDAEIAARYAATRDKYAAAQNRTVTQLIAPTQAAAAAILAEVKNGTSLEAAAKAKGLSAATLSAISQSALADQSSAEVAAAGFGAGKSALVGPVKGPLGWHLLRIDAIDNKPARSLEQARGEIAAALLAEKRRAALADLTAQIEDGLDKGGALSDAATKLGVTLSSSPPLTADGQIYGPPGGPAPKELARVVQTAFAMEREHLGQLAEVDPGKAYLIFDVAQITPSAVAPLAEIKGEVAQALVVEKGAIAAKAAAEKVLKAMKHGVGLDAALMGLGVPLPPARPITMGRDQLAAQGGKVPPPLALLFAMAQGTAKMMAVPHDQGWLIVQLAHIQPGVAAPGDPLVVQAAHELGQIAGNEYAEELRRAIRKEVGVSRNEVAIKAVAAQLVGGN